MIAALNDLEVKLLKILSAYIEAPFIEKMWTTLGPKFGIDDRRTAVNVRALYGLKSTEATFRTHLAKYMESFRYEPCKAHPDLLFKSE